MNDPNSYPHRGPFIMGTHAIRELLKHAPEKIVQIYTTQGKKSGVIEDCENQKIPISYVSTEMLYKMVQSDSHQNLVAAIHPRSFVEVKELLQMCNEKEEALVLMLDEIYDPQNFGAILRSAEGFGVTAVVWSKNRGTDVTPVVAKASSGASELVTLVRVSNLATTIDLFKDQGFEIVVSTLSHSAQGAYDFSYAPKTVLVLGSEGEGVQPLIQKKADKHIYLPMQGKIESLNVAGATAALLALWRLARPGE